MKPLTETVDQIIQQLAANQFAFNEEQVKVYSLNFNGLSTYSFLAITIIMSILLLYLKFNRLINYFTDADCWPFLRFKRISFVPYK